MYNNIRRTGRSLPPSDLVSVDAVRQIVKEMTNPTISPKKVIEGDGHAYKAYWYNISNPRKSNTLRNTLKLYPQT